MSSATPMQLLAALTHCRKEGFSLEKDALLNSGMRGLGKSGSSGQAVRRKYLPVQVYHTRCMHDVQNDTHRQMWRVIVHTVRRESDRIRDCVKPFEQFSIE
jgi:hypothetical protein